MEGNTVAVAGIRVLAPLKPILTAKPPEMEKREAEEDDDDYYCSSTTTTPTSAGSRIPSRILQCPPAPKKRKSAPAPTTTRCLYGGSPAAVVKEFFNPPDLETIFTRRAAPGLI
ncbi:cyclin-dependent protein kinase inhibitor SMR6-like [Andrographis paniculata]|uniref:cyclin-dependent protein kinase inhibitor SMR6-like n=1 Tax=Andrographis paniculata TaxID=175694 RepID=UPI0021E90632|nr:cyclin-dependent protein kinase inhibitor SMR6-like [Andrographis paniculata]